MWVGARIYGVGISHPLTGDLFGGARQQGTLGHPLPLAFLTGVAWIVAALERELVRHRRLILTVLSVGLLATQTVSVLLLVPATSLISGGQEERPFA